MASFEENNTLTHLKDVVIKLKVWQPCYCMLLSLRLLGLLLSLAIIVVLPEARELDGFSNNPHNPPQI